MEFKRTTLPEVVLIAPRVFEDPRGFSFEAWHAGRFLEAGIDAQFVQENHSHSVKGVLRGMHYQRTRPQGKLVRVLVGAVFDVVVDVRRSSSRFGQWFGTTLSREAREMLWIPPGFAHGYYTLSPEVDLVYLCTDHYLPSDECAFHWNDPAVGIGWPLPPDSRPILSMKDEAAPLLRDATTYP
jgi:dTDP-4-dehydrorhamnose 3,5-epimerase